MTSATPDRPARKYDSSGRRARAAGTRQVVLDTARRLFLADGYAATTIAAIALASGVSAPTVYAAFGTKAELLKRVIDVAVAGDDEEIPVADRPIMHWVNEASTADELLRRYAVMMGDLGERASPIYDVLYRAADTEPDLDALVEQYAAQRLIGAEQLATAVVRRGALPAGRSRASVRDQIWLCAAPEQYTLLVSRRGWSRDRYVAWATDVLLHLLEPPAR
jgi:AcrR family transcriptional regulator